MPIVMKPKRDAVYDLPQPPPRLHWEFQEFPPLTIRADIAPNGQWDLVRREDIHPMDGIDWEALRKDFEAIVANRGIHETEGVVWNYRRLTENQKSVGWGIMGEVAKNLAPVPFNRHMGMYLGGLTG